MILKINDNPHSDIYFEKDIVNNLKIKNIDEIETINEVDWLKTLDLNFSGYKKWYEKVSSGSSSYSLLKLVFNFLVFINKNNNIKREIKNYRILIDEPEKFCHPELIHKIADLIYELSKKFDMTISTHSNILLERIFKIDKEKKTKYFYFSKTKDEINNTYIYNDCYELKLPEELTKWHPREVSLTIKSIFSTNIILHEGPADEIYLNSLLESEKTDKYITFLDCYGKSGIAKIVKILDNLNLTNNINPLLSYDLDTPKKYIESNHHFIAMDPNLEKNFFKYYNNKNNEFELKNGKCISKKKIMSMMNEKEIINNSTLVDVKTIIENHKIEIRHWLENNEKHHEK